MKFSHFNGKEPNEELKEITTPTIIGYKDKHPLYRFTLKFVNNEIDFNDGEFHTVNIPFDCAMKTYMYVEKVCAISGTNCVDITNYINPITDKNRPTQMNWSLRKPMPPNDNNRNKVGIKADFLIGSDKIPAFNELLITIVMQEKK